MYDHDIEVVDELINKQRSTEKPLYGLNYSIVTMGCAKNEVDSARMRDLLCDAGAVFVDDVSKCDLIIVNTCSFIQSATEESIEMILDSLSLSNDLNQDLPVIVSGCMPARYGDDLANELSEVSAFVPCAEENNIVEVVKSCVHGLDKSNASMQEDAAVAIDLDPVVDDKSFAYVKISDGCDRWCSYCTIPIIRGRYHSFPFEEIDKTVAELIKSGKREIILIAQDTGRWGRDFDEPSSLADLMRRLADKYSDTWFRVMYVQPEGITDELLEVMSRYKNICSYLDIPLQHVNGRILKAMNRSGNRKDFVSLIEKIKSKVSDITLRTTLIAGFPGETESEFEELKDFVEEGFFDYVGVFPYSREDGTKAALLDGQLDEEEKKYRAATLSEIADAASSVNIAERIGMREDVLVEGVEVDGQLFGRCQSQAPEVDGITFIDKGNVGQFVRAKIVDTLFYDMEAESE